jgi:hypothetical protein
VNRPRGEEREKKEDAARFKLPLQIELRPAASSFFPLFLPSSSPLSKPTVFLGVSPVIGARTRLKSVTLSTGPREAMAMFGTNCPANECERPIVAIIVVAD